MILFSRTDVTNVYLEEQKKSQRMEELLLKAQTDPLTKICNFQATFDAISEKLTDTDDNYAFVSWISTISNRSTIPWVIWPGMRSFARWRTF